MTSAETVVLGDPYINTPLISWWDDFKLWIDIISTHRSEFDLNGKIIPENEFYPWLKEFLQDQEVGKFHQFDVILSSDETQIVASRMMAYNVPCNDTNDYVNSMKSIKETFANYAPTDPSFTYSVFYIFFEQYLNIVFEAWRGILGSLAVIVFFNLLLVMKIPAAFIAVFLIASIILMVIGFMYFWCIELNAISVVNLISATGLSVDFVSYVLKSFVESQGNRRERVERAMSEFGISILHGGICSLLSILVLAFIPQAIFRIYYFQMYLLIILLDKFVGLIILPILLDTMGPSPLAQEKKLFFSRNRK